ncbi:MAG: GlmU family protein [Ignavibacteriales bacterium]|nr:GlmU family protein [Ignavibacteriales bacterium]
MHLCIFEDQSVKHLLPLTHLQPVFELRCGCSSLREKIISCVPSRKISLITRHYLTEYTRECFPSYQINSLPDDDVWFVNGRVLADESLTKIIKKHDGSERVFLNGDEIVAAFIPKRKRSLTKRLKITDYGLEIGAFSFLKKKQVETKLIHYPWELVQNNALEIEKDFQQIKLLSRKQISGKIYNGAHLLNRKNLIIGSGSIIKPGVVLDAEHGPIIIEKNVLVMPNVVIEGPAYIGASSQIKVGAKIYPGTSIGRECRIGGEVTRSIFQSYSNKAHDGFVGDSYIGSWVNLGADTNTSNLKNTYGNVNVFINGKEIDSGSQFVGLTMGDHSKSGINVMFNTGSVVGTSCNIFGADFPQKYLPSFSWGSDGAFTTFDIEKSIEIARRMMSRRGVTMSSAYESMMRHVFHQTKQERKQWLKK